MGGVQEPRTQRVHDTHIQFIHHRPPARVGEDPGHAVRWRPGSYLQLCWRREHDTSDDLEWRDWARGTQNLTLVEQFSDLTYAYAHRKSKRSLGLSAATPRELGSRPVT